MSRGCLVLLACLAIPVASGDALAKKIDYFVTMDTNNDGRVTREEFFSHFPDVKPELFQKLDRNNDGLVDRDEWKTNKERINGDLVRTKVEGKKKSRD